MWLNEFTANLNQVTKCAFFGLDVGLDNLTCRSRISDVTAMVEATRVTLEGTKKRQNNSPSRKAKQRESAGKVWQGGLESTAGV